MPLTPLPPARAARLRRWVIGFALLLWVASLVYVPSEQLIGGTTFEWVPGKPRWAWQLGANAYEPMPLRSTHYRPMWQALAFEWLWIAAIAGVPYWFIGAATSRRPGACVGCGYDLHGLGGRKREGGAPSASASHPADGGVTCPECGVEQRWIAAPADRA